MSACICERLGNVDDQNRCAACPVRVERERRAHNAAVAAALGCEIGEPKTGRFHLRTIRATAAKLERIAGDPSFVHPFTMKELAVLNCALGALYVEAIAAGDRLDDPLPDDEGNQ